MTVMDEPLTFDGMEAPDGARFVGRCKCGKPHATISSRVFGKRIVPCGRCGRNVTLRRVIGEHNPSRACDARCMQATGPICLCSCGGRNHGGRYG